VRFLVKLEALSLFYSILPALRQGRIGLARPNDFQS